MHSCKKKKITEKTFALLPSSMSGSSDGVLLPAHLPLCTRALWDSGAVFLHQVCPLALSLGPWHAVLCSSRYRHRAAPVLGRMAGAMQELGLTGFGFLGSQKGFVFRMQS